MPSRNSQTQNTDTGFRLAGFLIIVIFACAGLAWLWLQLPESEQASNPPEQNTRPLEINQEKEECIKSGDVWVDCGLPKGCVAGQPCAEVCVPQCVARSEQAPEPVAREEQITEPTTPIREQPAGTICDAGNFICVDQEISNDELSSPFVAKGSGIAFENTINYRLLDGNGNTLIEGFTMAQAPDVGQPGVFEIRDFILSEVKTTTGTLEVFEYSAKDGTPIHQARVPVTLPKATMKTKFYLPSNDANDCGSVVSFEREVARSSLPVETALRALLKFGPSINSKQSAIPEKTRLISVKVSAGTATVILSPELSNYGGGSCNIEAIRAQIETTLKQFSSVKNVVIIEQGKSAEETLQP